MKWIRIHGHLDFMVRRPQKDDQAIPTNLIGSLILFFNIGYYHICYFIDVNTILLQKI